MDQLRAINSSVTTLGIYHHRWGLNL